MCTIPEMVNVWKQVRHSKIIEYCLAKAVNDKDTADRALKLYFDIVDLLEEKMPLINENKDEADLEAIVCALVWLICMLEREVIEEEVGVEEGELN